MNSYFDVDSINFLASPSPSTSSSTCNSPVRRPSPPPDAKKIVLGVCAMDKKTRSKPMAYILDRIRQTGEIEVNIFGDDVILNKPIEAWPIVDCLVAFFSTGFPLEKVEAYTELRKPFVINDIKKQYTLLDRRETYTLLQAHGIPVPRHIIYLVEEEKELVEGEDYVELDGVRINKPFVEKPISGEDHNIYIYYPKSAGGGSKRLYRKVENRSSDFYPDVCTVRRNASYIYEEFMPTGGTDLKVYTVGPDYAHAEARKSPVVDGRVQRDSQGKEIRYPVILTSNEKEIARKVVRAFGQLVCGFDLLRSSHDSTSYVCDVNGWSFVKNSQKYYDDCAQLLKMIMINEIAPERFTVSPWALEASLPSSRPGSPFTGNTGSDDDPSPLASPIPLASRRPPNAPKSRTEIRCVVAVIRHADRTPKQKLKMKVFRGTIVDPMLELFDKHGSQNPRQELKLKSAVELQAVLDTTRSLLQILEEKSGDTRLSLNDIETEAERKLGQVKTVLEKGGHFSGINRKIQFKPIDWKTVDGKEIITEALFIAKWGGQLTDMGIYQSQALGSRFRLTMYPGEDGLLRLHSTYRHDLKIYTSDEGRVQVTSAAFAKSFLNLEGELTPILVSLVRKDKFSHILLDDASAAAEDLSAIKLKLSDIMNQDIDLDDETINKLVPTKGLSLIRALQNIKNPWKTLVRTHELIKSLTEQVSAMFATNANVNLSEDETLTLMHRRWRKLEEDFFNVKKQRFDISKVPDIYDCIHYDMLHNQHLNLKDAEELYTLARDLAGYVVPQEYGIDAEEKLRTGVKICEPLLRKMWYDLRGESLPKKITTETATSDTTSGAEGFHQLDPRHVKGEIDYQRHVRTRLYFTSESHIQSLLNVLRYYSPNNKIIAPEAAKKIETISQLNYLTHIVFKVYENYEVDENDPTRYTVELLFSSGTKEFTASYLSSKAFPVSSMFRLNNKLTLKEVEEFFSQVIPAEPDS